VTFSAPVSDEARQVRRNRNGASSEILDQYGIDGFRAARDSQSAIARPLKVKNLP
jgi:hypothetical protein